jgi:uncharacterized Fe-S cluster protein YjdI
MSRRRYTGHAIDVTFDARVCRHSGNCVRGLPQVFDAKKKPWIQPDGASAEAVAQAVARCPSGALQVEPPVEQSG